MGKGSSKGQGKGGVDWNGRGSTDGGRPQWVCDGCNTENRMGRVACRICWAPRPRATKREPGEGLARQGTAVGADGRKPLLGTRGEGWRTLGGKGAATRTAATTTPTTSAKAPLGASPPCGGKPSGGGGSGGGEGYTVVNYRTGDRPRVQTCNQSDHSSKEDRNNGDGVGKGQGGQGDAKAKGGLGAHRQNLENETRREWYDIEDGPEVLYEEWVGEDEDGEGGGIEDEDEPEGPSELEQATDLVRIKRDMYTGLRDRNGRGHATAKKAYEELREAEEWLRQVKGPRTWLQEAGRLHKQKKAAERAQDKLEEQMDAEKTWFQEVAEAHELRMEGMREKWDSGKARIKELESKLETIRREPAEDEGDEEELPGEWSGSAARVAASNKVRDIVGQVARALEVVGGDEQTKGALSTIRARVGELENILKPAASGKGSSKEETTRQTTQQQCTRPRLGEQAESGHGKGGGPSGCGGEAKGGGKDRRGSDDKDDHEQSPQAKWARRGARRGRGHEEERQSGDDMDGVEDSHQAEAAMGSADAAAEESRRQRALDKIRARLQQEKVRKAEELQAKAAEGGAPPEPHLLSQEQLDENRRRMEAANREVDEEAEKELAAMSREQLAKIMEDDWQW